MARQKVVSDFIPDFKRVSQYNRKYINLPYDTVYDKKFLDMPSSYHKLFIVLGIFSFERAETSGWFPATMKELMEKSGLSERTIQDAKRHLEKEHFLDIGLGFRKNSGYHFSDVYRINGFKDISTP